MLLLFTITCYTVLDLLLKLETGITQFIINTLRRCNFDNRESHSVELSPQCLVHFFFNQMVKDSAHRIAGVPLSMYKNISCELTMQQQIWSRLEEPSLLSVGGIWSENIYFCSTIKYITSSGKPLRWDMIWYENDLLKIWLQVRRIQWNNELKNNNKSLRLPRIISGFFFLPGRG